MWLYYFVTVADCNIAGATARRWFFSSTQEDEIRTLAKGFSRFKQQFDRGVTVQMASTLARTFLCKAIPDNPSLTL